MTSSELSDPAHPRSVASDSSGPAPIEVRPPSLGQRLWTFATQHIPARWGELGKGLFGMSALASLVPFLDDPWLSGVFLGVSGVSLIRVLRQEAESFSPDLHPSAEPQEPLPSDRDSEAAAAAATAPAALIRIHDSLDRTADPMADIGKTLPLLIPQIWFGASLLTHAADGNWYYAAVSLAGTIFTSIPMFFMVRRGIFKLRDRWQAVEAHKELEGESAEAASALGRGLDPERHPAGAGSLPGGFEDGPLTLSNAGIEQEG